MFCRHKQGYNLYSKGVLTNIDQKIRKYLNLINQKLIIITNIYQK
jgi:hypothetical protein